MQDRLVAFGCKCLEKSRFYQSFRSKEQFDDEFYNGEVCLNTDSFWAILLIFLGLYLRLFSWRIVCVTHKGESRGGGEGSWAFISCQDLSN